MSEIVTNETLAQIEVRLYDGRWTVEELSDAFQLSEEAIRRSIRRLDDGSLRSEDVRAAVVGRPQKRYWLTEGEEDERVVRRRRLGCSMQSFGPLTSREEDIAANARRQGYMAGYQKARNARFKGETA